MKIICKGQVYDLDYGKSERICQLKMEMRLTELGYCVAVTAELRRDKATGAFYVLEANGDYDRSGYKVFPMTADEAKRTAEDFLDYDAYVKVFGDPEGPVMELERKLEETLGKLKSAEEHSTLWYDECQKAKAKLNEIEKLAGKAKEAQ